MDGERGTRDMMLEEIEEGADKLRAESLTKGNAIQSARFKEAMTFADLHIPPLWKILPSKRGRQRGDVTVNVLLVCQPVRICKTSEWCSEGLEISYVPQVSSKWQSLQNSFMLLSTLLTIKD